MKVYQLMVQAGDVNLLVENTHTSKTNTETLLIRLGYRTQSSHEDAYSSVLLYSSLLFIVLCSSSDYVCIASYLIVYIVL